MKPHRALADYLQGVEAALAASRGAYVESYVEELLTPRRANPRIQVRFTKGRLPEGSTSGMGPGPGRPAPFSQVRAME